MTCSPRGPSTPTAACWSCPLSPSPQVLLSVAGDGSICLVPLQQLAQASGHTFKQATGWSGYSQGRWVDSNIFATVSAVCGTHCLPTTAAAIAWHHTAASTTLWGLLTQALVLWACFSRCAAGCVML